MGLPLETNTGVPIPGPVPPAPLPAVVACLGYGGLVPLLAPLLAIVRDPHHDVLWQQAQLAYGAVILSFVGALHWGFAMALPGLGASAVTRFFAWSVMPALIAWLALLMAIFGYGMTGSVVLILGFGAHYLQDRALARQAALPAWYLPLRTRLTLVACLSLVLGAALTNATPFAMLPTGGLYV